MDEAPLTRKKKKGYTARLDGDALVLSHDAPLPAVCMKCGTHDGIMRRYVVFSWSPAWVRYLVFCGIGLFLRLLMRVRASLVVPLCARCNARWSAARSASIGGVALLVAAVIAARVLGPNDLARGLVLAAIAALVLVRLVFVRPRVLQVHHLDENAISFLAVDAGAVKEIVEGSRS